MRILTAGITELDFKKFESHGSCELNKPRFGLYGSTVVINELGTTTSWLRFVFEDWFYGCTRSEIMDSQQSRYLHGISYKLHKKSKIYTVNSADSYFDLLKRFPLINDDEIRIDWNTFSNNYDAFHLTEDAFWELRMIYRKCFIDGNEYRLATFYSYDCETWIVFNPYCINLGSIRNVSINLNQYIH